MRYKIIFSYDGSDYFGYAKQPNKKTIQGEIEGVLATIFQKEVGIFASGRTDKGVHALNQVAHFDLDKEVDLDKLLISINKLLPDDIFVKKIEKVEEYFHSRFSAKSKIYEYVINFGEYNPLKRNFEYNFKNIDIEKMKSASKLFVGTHNFQNFTSKEEDEENFIRRIESIDFNIQDNVLKIEFLGNGFMKYQVRKIVGVLLEVGKQKIDEKYILEFLNKSERDIVTFTAPPQGLYLKKVIY